MKRKPKSRTAPKGHDAGQSCRALVVMDSARIRRKALANLQRAQATFRKAEAELTAFESEDQLAFKRWFRTEFGPRLEEIKELSDQANALRERMTRIQRFSEMKRCSLRVATGYYERSFAEFERMEAHLREQWIRANERRQREEEEREQQLHARIFEELKAFLNRHAKRIRRSLGRDDLPADVLMAELMEFDARLGVPFFFSMELLDSPEGRAVLEALGLQDGLTMPGVMSDEDDEGVPFDFEDGFSDSFHRQPPAGRREESASMKEARIKALYRDLAFALHPDQSDSSHDPQRLELWHQVQEAMATRDVDRLEVLHAHMQVLSGEVHEATPVSRLIDLTEMIRVSRNALRRRIRDLRKQIEWGFSRADETHKQRAKTVHGSLLKDEFQRMQSEMTRLQTLYREHFASHAAPVPRRVVHDVNQPVFPGWD